MAKNPSPTDGLYRASAYIQVASALRRRIETGQWKPEEKISTLDELEAEFAVSRVTISKAVELLEQEQLLSRQQGRGTFVMPQKTEKRWLTLGASWNGLIQAIEHSKPRFVQIQSASAPEFPVLAPGEATLAGRYVYLRSVQEKDGVPYALASVHLDAELFNQNKSEFRSSTALSVLARMKGLRIKKAYQTMEIQTSEQDVAALLRISLSAPTVACRCIVINEQDVAIYVGEIIYRGDSLRISMDLLPE